jgi:short-subunit dehydrogenase
MRKGLPTFKGQSAVITGAASGIGCELARNLIVRGCSLALLDQDSKGLAELQAEFQSEGHSPNFSVHTVDVANRDQMKSLPIEVARIHGEINLLINSAGIGYEAAFGQTSLETWDHVLGVNLWGVVHTCHMFMPHLAKADRAHIVNISSLFGYVGMPGQTAYSASKFAVRGFSEALLEELRSTSVGLTLVYPGSVRTNIMRNSGGDDHDLMEYLASWYDKHAMAPAIAADRIVAAIQKGQPRLRIGPEAYLADYLKRFMPVAGNKLFSDLVIRVLGLEYMRAKRSQQWQDTMVDRTP